ncbi:MAG: 50S ribosomal protein L29 [Bacteroidetes bacterium]|jgi:large subunit ribosomal protein L29|nr:MAG: 50S ribosomal protein L29 [Bacteroidota bacterium]
MKQKDIILLSEQELKEKIQTEKNKLVDLKLKHAIAPIENPMEIRKTRRNIARLLTELNKRMKNKNNQ